MNEIFRHEGQRIAKLVTALLALLVVFFGVKTLETWRQYRNANYGVTIEVSGEGEVFTKPDIAEFTFSVTSKAKTVADAQAAATKIANDSIAFLKKSGIAEKDIRTENYTFYPQYEYRQDARICDATGCYVPGGKQILTGYEVNQTMRVKVRDLDKAGEILSGVGKLGVTNLGGIELKVEDEEAAKSEAREMAIKNADEKAEKLADDLGLRIVRIVAFTEGGQYPIYGKYADGRGSAVELSQAGNAPAIPAGENRIVSNIVVTYELR